MTKKKSNASGLEGINDLDEGIENASAGDDVEEQKRKIKELEEEKKELANVIEKLSSESDDDPPERAPKQQPVQQQSAQNVQPMLDSIEKKFNDQLKEITGAISQIGEKLKKSEKDTGGESVKKIVSKVQEATEEKISSIESALKQMSEKLNAPPEIPTRGGEDISKGLSAFGETMDFKDDIIEVKNSLRKLKADLDEFKESSEAKFIRLKDQAKDMSKLANIEERLDFLNEKFGAENIEKLNKLVLSANELSESIIPKEITKKLDAQVVPLYNNISKMKEGLVSVNKKLTSEMNEFSRIKAGFREIKNIKEDASERDKESKKLMESLNERDTRLKEMIDEQRERMKAMKKELTERVTTLHDYTKKAMKEEVKELFKEFSDARFNELEDRSTKNLIIAKQQVNEMISNFNKMDNYVQPKLQLMNDQLEKMEERVNDFEEDRKNFARDAEDVINYKFKEVVDARLNDMEKTLTKSIESNGGKIDSIDSRLSQMEDLVSPSIKMFGNQLSKFETRLEKFKDSQANTKDYMGKMKDDIDDLQETARSVLQLKDYTEKIGDKTKEIDELREMIKELKDNAVREKRDLANQISGINKGLDFLSGLGKDTNQNKKDIEDLKERDSELKESIKMLKGQFDNVITQSLLERKDLMENSKRQKAQINEILKELKNI
ncbi:MAG: hypothetical protein JW754_02430 [Candidatus Aenigmarchaeota archaeon]|nr:hypothetical protein [Candidatus Aenigmarchaeota archaeon]